MYVLELVVVWLISGNLKLVAVSNAIDAWIIGEACDGTDSSAGSHHHNLALPQRSSPPKFRLRAITAIGSTWVPSCSRKLPFQFSHQRFEMLLVALIWVGQCDRGNRVSGSNVETSNILVLNLLLKNCNGNPGIFPCGKCAFCLVEPHSIPFL